MLRSRQLPSEGNERRSTKDPCESSHGFEEIPVLQTAKGKLPFKESLISRAVQGTLDASVPLQALRVSLPAGPGEWRSQEGDGAQLSNNSQGAMVRSSKRPLFQQSRLLAAY